MTSADICNNNGWGVGDVLEGVDHTQAAQTVRIKLTAIGEQLVLAKMVSYNGQQVNNRPEILWSLHLRDWKRVS